MKNDTFSPDRPVTQPSFSVVICTDGRAAALRNTLKCLQFVDYSPFEVVVVHGPTEDGTRELLAQHAGRIKVAACPERNLSVSRNIGIALSAGEIVAFIDDDGLAEPEWLRDLHEAFQDPKVGGAGGVVYDHTGAKPQYIYSSANRLGQADWARTTSAEIFNFPLSYNFPYVQGTNSAFRRSALLEIGGFDEEYEFYLDETDVCCRMIDAGYHIRQLTNAPVHHKFLPSEIRNEHKVTRYRYAVLKNKIYFSLINNHGHRKLSEIIQDGINFVADHDRDIRFHIEHGRLNLEDLTTFEADVEMAWEVGLNRGLSGRRRLLREETLAAHASAFLPYPKPIGDATPRTLVYITQEYPPGRMGGIGRFVHQLARDSAGYGHHVHVLTRGEGHDRVDFEDGVWVHRLLDRAGSIPLPRFKIPPHIWDHAATMAQELDGIAEKRTITAVCAPIWDCEGIAVLDQGRYPLVTSLQTSLRSWLSSNKDLAAQPGFMENFGAPMLEVEARMFRGSDGIFSISHAILKEVEKEYRLHIDRERVAVIPLGLEDWTALPSVEPPVLPPGSVRLLFVGRLESRKGIDVLLHAAKTVLADRPYVHLDIVGNDTIPGPDGRTWKSLFEEDLNTPDVRSQIHFRGEVSEERLRGFYAACDVLVGPSRFESFGLMLVEGMMFGKPVIGCRAGGMVEIVDEGRTGLLAEPGDVSSLAACLLRLIDGDELRDAMGNAARADYLERFTPDRMTADVIDFLIRVGDKGVAVSYAGQEAVH